MLGNHWVQSRVATYHLLIGEQGSVVDQCHAVAGVAVCTRAGLSNAASVHLHPGGMGTYLALEKGLLHLRNQL